MHSQAIVTTRITRQLLFRTLIKRSSRRQIAAVILASLLGYAASLAITGDPFQRVAWAAVIGGVAAFPTVVLAGKLLAGQAGAALTTLRWHRARFRTEADLLIDELRLDQAGAAIENQPTDSAWNRFERARLRAELAVASGEKPAADASLALSAVDLVGLEAFRASGAVRFLGALEAASSGGDWIKDLAELGPSILTNDNERNPSAYRRWLMRLAVFAAVVGALEAALIALVFAVLR